MQELIVKTCSLCKKEKPSSEFTKDPRCKHGVGSWCLDCKRAKDREYRSRPEAKAQRSRYNREKRQDPTWLAHRKAQNKIYRARPEVKKHKLEHERERYKDPKVRRKSKEAQARFHQKNPKAMRLYGIKYRFGLTKEQWLSLVEKHDGHCAICGDGFAKIEPYIDHNHLTGKVRGLLCASCNSGLARFRDDVRLLEKAVDYLKEHDGKSETQDV